MFLGEPWLAVWTEHAELPDGRRVDDFYKLEMPDYATVVARGAAGIVVQRQYKPGAHEVGLTFPGGYIDPGENPLTAAQRELREETGYVAEDWSSLGRFVVDANRGAGTAHFFLADRAHQLEPPSDAQSEGIEPFVLPLAQLVQALRRGEILDLAAATAIGLAALEWGKTRPQVG